MINSAMIKKYAKECGADLVGIASMERFEGAPKQNDPRYIFPEAKAMIVLGFRVPRGCFRGIEEGTYFANYGSFGYYHINLVYAMNVLRELSCYIEDNGYEAVPYDNTSVRLGAGQGRAVHPDKPKPDVYLDFRIAAVAAGLGEIGYSKLFLSPEFGPRQRLALLLTDAPLKPDPLFTGQICDRCMLCVKECTGNAIDPEITEKVIVGGKVCEWGKLDLIRCALTYDGGVPEVNPFMPWLSRKLYKYIISRGNWNNKNLSFRIRKKLWYIIRNRLKYYQASWESYHHPSPIEGARGCTMACMIHLEKTGRIKAEFKQPFKKREPWLLDNN